MHRLIKEFKPYHKLLKDFTLFVPHYISHESPQIYSSGAISPEHCLGGGKFCASPKYELGVIEGRIILLEDIREKCVYNMAYNTTDDTTSPNLYWEYMSSFYDTCINIDTPKFDHECAYDVADAIGIGSSQVKDCMAKSFSVSDYNELLFTNNNTLLESDDLVRQKFKVQMFPNVMVNSKPILGAYTAENLFEAVCAGFINKPKPWKEYFTVEQIEEVTKPDIDAGWGQFFW